MVAPLVGKLSWDACNVTREEKATISEQICSEQIIIDFFSISGCPVKTTVTIIFLF
jgi:hypothetical protein